MTSLAEPDTSERYMAIARRWFTEGWTGNLAMADDIFSEDVRTNGVHVGVAGPVGRIRDRLTGFPDLTTNIQDMFVAGDKLAVTLIWRGTHTGSYAGDRQARRGPRHRDLALPGRQGHRDLDAAGPVRDAETDRVPTGKRARRLTAGAVYLAEEGTSWICA